MTREELKAHCERVVRNCESLACNKYEGLDNNKVYQEHKLILELLDHESREIAISKQLIKEQMLKYGFHSDDMTVTEFVEDLPLLQPEIIRCEDCIHNGSFDTDCPITQPGKEYCSYAEDKYDLYCSSCEYQDEVDGSNCYECVKGIHNNYKAKK